MTRHLVIALVTTAAAGVDGRVAHADEPPASRSEISFGGALGLTQIREDLVAPIRFIGPSLALDGGYARETAAIAFETRLRFSAAATFDRFGTNGWLLSPALVAKLHATVARPEVGAVRIGGFVGAREILVYYPQWDDTHLYWLGITGVGPSAQLVTPARKQREVLFELSLPLVAIVTRPPLRRDYKADDLVDAGFWLGRIGAHPEVTSIHELQSLAARAVWRGATTGWWIDPWAMIELDHFSEPDDVTHLAMWLGVEAKVLR